MLYKTLINASIAVNNFIYKNKSYNRFILYNNPVISYIENITSKCLYKYPKDNDFSNQSESNIGEYSAYNLLIEIFNQIKKIKNLDCDSDGINKISYNLQMLNLIQSYNYVIILITINCNNNFLNEINKIRNKSFKTRKKDIWKFKY